MIDRMTSDRTDNIPLGADCQRRSDVTGPMSQVRDRHTVTLLQVFPQPAMHGFPPEPSVPGFRYEVVLVGEDEQQ